MELKSRIHWQEWNKESFEKAQREDKLILLFIYASWCHWCQVMQETSYANEAIGKLINNNFIPIAVDTDKRPDINERYNMGGWPSTLVLLPDGEIVKGSTYLSPSELTDTLSQIIRNYHTNKNIFLELSRQKKNIRKKQHPLKEIKNIKLDSSIIKQILKRTVANYDSLYSGFGFSQKFPHPSLIELCLNHYFYTRNENSRQIVFNTLKVMGDSELYDSIDGGFFRYSTTRDWKTPHFEKLLEDNARLTKIYLDAAVVLGYPEFKDKARHILRYVEKFLGHKKGGFYGSQQAARNYYLLNDRERERHSLPPVDKSIYTPANALMSCALFRASSVLRDDHCRLLAIKAIDFLIQRSRNLQTGGMYHYFDDSPRVYGLLLDQTFMLQALVEAYQATSIPKYLKLAEESADFILKYSVFPDKGRLRDRIQEVDFCAKLKEIPLCLREQSLVASNLISLSFLTQKDKYKLRAKKILTSLLGDYDQEWHLAVDYALSLTKYINDPLIITIIGGLKRKEDKELVSRLLEFYYPIKIVRYQTKGRGIISPQANLKLAAHLSLGTTCNLMIKSPANLEKILEKKIIHPL